MRLRPRQKVFVERSLAALSKHGNTLGVAPTGAGKTIMLSAVTGKLVEETEAKACVLAHRDELTGQNRAKFARVNPEVTTSQVDAGSKSWNGQVTFAMAPTLSRSASLKAMPRLDLLVIDEAHHAVADSYRRIIDRVRDANPDARIFGVTATPTRNGTALGNVVSAEITYANNLDRIETIRSDGRIDGADPSIAALTGRIEVRFADQTLVTQAINGEACEMEFAYVLPSGESFTFTVHAVYLPRPRIEISGPQGVQATFDWQAARDSVVGRMCTATLVNDVETY